jgi:hypothetical protein
VRYIKGQDTSPVFKEQANFEAVKNIETKANSSQHFQKMADLWLNEYVQKRGLKQPKFSFAADGCDNNLDWLCSVQLEVNQEQFCAEGYGKTKKDAKRGGCENIKMMLSNAKPLAGKLMIDGKDYHGDTTALVDLLNKMGLTANSSVKFTLPPTENGLDTDYVTSNSATPDAMRGVKIEPVVPCHGVYHRPSCIGTVTKTNGPFKNRNKMRKYLQKKYRAITNISDEAICVLTSYKCTEKVDEIVQQYARNYLQTSEPEYVRSNADMPIEPATINQSATGQQIGVLPSSTNPQPTGTIPAMTSSGEDIMANLQYAEQQVLNPVGAPNMLAVGAITFDIKMLIYEQFLDADIEFEITDDTPSGGIIAQIPYGVNHPFVNSYIKTYAGIHGRYAGAIQYRVTVVGNPMFSGVIGVAWQPRRITTSTILISEAQKFAYSAKGVTMPWNVIHTLHDGRQELFYRTTNEAMDDNRPHLVVFLMMSLQNPLREGVVTRMRIASKLANAAEPNPFVFSEPRIAIAPAPASTTSNSNTSTPTPFNETFVSATNTPVSIYTDGTASISQVFKQGIQYPEYNPHAFNMGGARTRAVSASIPPETDLMSTGTSRYYNNDPEAQALFKGQWPEIWYTVEDRVRYQFQSTVSVMTQTTNDPQSFATLCIANNLKGMGNVDSSETLHQISWQSLRAATGWNTVKLNRVEAPVKILSVLYNDTTYIINSGRVHLEQYQYLVMGGYTKVVTDKGVTIFYLLGMISPMEVYRNDRDMFGLMGLSSPNHMAILPSFPYLNIDEQLGFTAPFHSLPLGYQALRIADFPPSSLLIEGYPGPTATDNTTITRWFTRRAEGLPLTQCLQIRLVDAVSVRSIAVIRFLQETNEFVINNPSPTAYRVLPVNTSGINIQSITTIDRTNEFPITDTSAWFARTSPAFLRTGVFKTNALGFETNDTPIFEYVKSNAAVALSMLGGGMQGIGSAIGSIQDRKHQTQMQSNQFGHEELMQGNMFGFQNQFQSNNFDFQKLMQQNTFGQEKSLQYNRFNQEKEMLNESSNQTRRTNAASSKNRMTERGLSSRVNFLTHPGSSTA